MLARLDDRAEPLHQAFGEHRGESWGGAGPPKVEQHLWPLLVVIALFVLLFEWHVYHRRY